MTNLHIVKNAAALPMARNSGPARTTGTSREINIGNLLLRSLRKQSLNRLLPHLKQVDLKRGTVLYELDAPVEHVYFVNTGIVSLIKTMRDGRTVEIGAIGIDGLTGVNALFDVHTAMFETLMQVPGNAYKIPVDVLRTAMSKDKRLHNLIENYVHVILGQIAQTAACNRLHSLEERCCRWLLICHDSAGSDEFQLTHEFLAMMLGARRVSVTMVANSLQQAGLIRYRKGRMRITSRPGLESHACECYSTVHSLSQRLLARQMGK